MEFRYRALAYHGARCNSCHREKARLGPGEWLEVDHLTYARVGREWLQDVQILCNTCHKRKTLKARRWRKVKRLFRV